MPVSGILAPIPPGPAGKQEVLMAIFDKVKGMGLTDYPGFIKQMAPW